MIRKSNIVVDYIFFIFFCLVVPTKLNQPHTLAFTNVEMNRHFSG
jgi:hypothetical protein